jgi:hypothetical protein
MDLSQRFIVPMDVQLLIVDIFKKCSSNSAPGKLRLVCKAYSRSVSVDHMVLTSWKKMRMDTIAYVSQRSFPSSTCGFVTKAFPMLEYNIMLKIKLYDGGEIFVPHFIGPFEKNVTNELVHQEAIQSFLALEYPEDAKSLFRLPK